MEPSSRNTIVSVKDVRKVYTHEGKTLEVLKGVSLELHAGELVSIIGKSGAGKSTLLHLIGTLDRPSSGTIEIDGKNTSRMTGAQLARLRNELVGFVFQFHHLLPEFTAVENVMMPGLILGTLSRSELHDRAAQFLEDVNLAHRMTHRPSELSGGEQQRVALARALVLRPRMLLADEPSGNLDTDNSRQIHDLFFQLNEKHGTTMVVVTHNERLAAAMPRVIKMNDGLIEGEENRPRAGSYTEQNPSPSIEPPSPEPNAGTGVESGDAP